MSPYRKILLSVGLPPGSFPHLLPYVPARKDQIFRTFKENAMKTKRFLCVIGITGAALVMLFFACEGSTGPPGEEYPPEEVCTFRPCARADFFPVPKNTHANVLPVLSNDINFNGHTGGANLGITAVSAPAHGSATITGGATTVTYTPITNFAGTDTFTYTIVDTVNVGDGPSTATVTVKVE